MHAPQRGCVLVCVITWHESVDQKKRNLFVLLWRPWPSECNAIISIIHIFGGHERTSKPSCLRPLLDTSAQISSFLKERSAAQLKDQTQPLTAGAATSPTKDDAFITHCQIDRHIYLLEILTSGSTALKITLYMQRYPYVLNFFVLSLSNHNPQCIFSRSARSNTSLWS